MSYIESLFLPQLNASRLPLYRINSTSPLPEFSIVSDSSSSQPVSVSIFLIYSSFSHHGTFVAFSNCSHALSLLLISHTLSIQPQEKCVQPNQVLSSLHSFLLFPSLLLNLFLPMISHLLRQVLITLYFSQKMTKLESHAFSSVCHA